MRSFSLHDPLPSGTTVLEASAGTGKTYTIAALAVRFLAEGRHTVADLLIVTFSRAATAELRSRVRERVRSSAVALNAALAGSTPDDPLDAWLAATDANTLTERAKRLDDAFNNFDRATIMTTHEFAHTMIRGLGVLANQQPQSRLVEDLRPLADEVAADVYLQRYAFAERPPPFTFFDAPGSKASDPGARTFARDVAEKLGSLEPTDSQPPAAERVAFATAIRQEVELRKSRLNLFSFNDQLLRLDAALNDPDTGPLACAKLARRFPVVLVDEFQDTDPVQWRILRSAFGNHSDSTLILIGDPKQAIYRFRGADIHAYTSAVEQSDSINTLTTNYRSDKSVVDAVGSLFSGISLGPSITAPAVWAAQQESRLVARDHPWSAGLQVRCLESDNPVNHWVGSRRITSDVVDVVVTLLSKDSPLRHKESELRANDVAILVRSNKQGQQIAQALVAAGVPTSFSGTTSVFTSEAATDWETLLTALDRPRRPFLTQAILTRFFGGTVTALATATDAEWAAWSLRLHTWARTLQRDGVPALEAAIERDTSFAPRLLGQASGERLLTDYQHIGELLAHQMAPPANRISDAIAWLQTAISEASADERTRRLETDDSAVQVMTIHRAKGRQFPIVLLPEAASAFAASSDSGATLDLPTPGDRILDVGGSGHQSRAVNFKQAQIEDLDEALRTLYVGVTRAQSHAIIWWANTTNTPSSALHRLLHARRGADPIRPEVAYPPSSPLQLPWLEAAGIATVSVPPSNSNRKAKKRSTTSELTSRSWIRSIDHSWRRTSYSGLTASAHSEHTTNDEPEAEVSPAPDPALSLLSPMAHLPSGTTFGTLVHAVMERVDARLTDWQDHLLTQCDEALRRRPLENTTPRGLADALTPVYQTPLGPLAPGVTLRDFGPGNRLSELDFEFGLNATGALGDLVEILRPHLLGTPLASYPERLASPEVATQSLRGFLTGSIDAVLRLPTGRHIVVDYKTNRLAGSEVPNEELTIGHYAPTALAQAMMSSHYPLQALLYSVALHRFLRQRLRGYDPSQHLGGTAYLFVRGMAGPDTPTVSGSPTGVFSWQPSVRAITQVSDFLAGGVVT